MYLLVSHAIRAICSKASRAELKVIETWVLAGHLCPYAGDTFGSLLSALMISRSIRSRLGSALLSCGPCIAGRHWTVCQS